MKWQEYRDALGREREWNPDRADEIDAELEAIAAPLAAEIDDDARAEAAKRPHFMSDTEIDAMVGPPTLTDAEIDAALADDPEASK